MESRQPPLPAHQKHIFLAVQSVNSPLLCTIDSITALKIRDEGPRDLPPTACTLQRTWSKIEPSLLCIFQTIVGVQIMMDPDLRSKLFTVAQEGHSTQRRGIVPP